jgi:hypothetical protein
VRPDVAVAPHTLDSHQRRQEGIMTKTTTQIVPTFTGSETAAHLQMALAALPAGAEIVTVSAGENMPILIAWVPEDGYSELTGYIDEYAWNGSGFDHYGFL